MRHNDRSQSSLNKQRGNTLVIAIFVIVVLGALVAALSNLVRTTSESVVVEVLGTRSFMAAQSGVEQGMMKLYPLDGAPATACPDFSEDIAVGNCEAAIACESATHTPDSNETYIHFRLEATGTCTAGGQAASRKLAIETRVKN
ncbi:Type II secretory pathway component [Idiomarina sp.]|uniref:Type II secretory pathway component n=1 Tax=Idiomarina sp. TaxID=1874361 RepID=UPI003A9012FD